MLAAKRWLGMTAALGAALGMAACSTVEEPKGAAAAVAETSQRAAVRAHIAALADDAMEGRAPGTAGEQATLAYLRKAFESAGLESGTNSPSNPWLQPVSLTRPRPISSEVSIASGNRSTRIGNEDTLVLTTAPTLAIENAPMVYVGRAWDVARSDIEGRVALAVGDHRDAAQQRSALLDRGAIAVLAMFDSKRRFGKFVDRQQRERYRLASVGNDGVEVLTTQTALDGALGADRVNRLLGRRDQSVATPINATISITAKSTRENLISHNLIAKLPGENPDGRAVLVLGHWDHLGVCGEAGDADRICNGAVDNASGLALMIELARSLSSGERPDRDVYFLATTAEEWGLLGAKAFAQEPAIPLDSIVAAFNLDTAALATASARVGIIGLGRTGLDAMIMEEVAKAGRKVARGDSAERFVRRQDGWALLRRDVPTVTVSTTFGSPRTLNRFLNSDYHGPGDEADKVELGGAMRDLALHIAMVRRMAGAGVESGDGE